MPKTLVSKTLVIVESPAKAKKIGSYLGSEFTVKSSVGHIRDLPVPSKLPEKVKAQNNGGFKRFAVDVDHDFEPYYAISYGKNKTVADLKSALKNADELLLATDEDREGEAIAWHLLEVLKPKVPVKRMVFHEITKDAIQKALENTREIDYDLVDAQETRRILDRLFGFQVSPYLWRKFGTGLSAGRVQSVATRIVVDREKERMAFKSAEFFDITGQFAQIHAKNDTQSDNMLIEAKMTHFEGRQLAVSKDFSDSGVLNDKAVKNNVKVLDLAGAEAARNALTDADTEFEVLEVLKKPYTSRPKPPFTTSTLQQAGVNRLKMSSARVMGVAQSLYENGYITYMRTDSPSLSEEATKAARNAALKAYGNGSIPEKPKYYAAKSGNAQEAHEAIRPAGSTFQTPESLSAKLDSAQLALYDLIYKRTIASQMNDAKGSTTTLKIGAENGDLAVFSASGTVISDRGYLQAYDDNLDTKDSVRLPDANEGEALESTDIRVEGHQTKPPARYTEATLVRKMEEYGIGRPSTYASTIQTIQDRGYIIKNNQQLVPTWLAFGVNRVLEDSLAKYVDYDFTAQMEEDLDKIADGKTKRNAWLSDFWFGTTGKNGENLGLEKDTDELKMLIESKASDDVFEIGESGRYQVRVTPYGAFFEDKQGTPDKENRLPRGYINVEFAPDELNDEMAGASIKQGVGIANSGKKLGLNPATGYEIVATAGKYGPYFTEILPDDVPTKGKGAVKPKTGSLLSTMKLETVTLDDALKVFELPKVLGTNPSDDEKISVQNGRFGPYMVKKDLATGKPDYRTIRKTETETAEERMFSVTLEEAIEEYSHPKIYRRAPRKTTRK